MRSFLITCCNATCAIPEAHREIFKGSEDMVASTAGWEPGSLNLAQGLAMAFSTPLIHGEVTRLLIDLEQDGDGLWSMISSKLPEAVRGKLIDRQQKKFRQAIESRLAEDFRRHESVIHFHIHTAPTADGQIMLEYAGAPLAQDIAETALSDLPSSEVDSTAGPLIDKTPLIRWFLENCSSNDYGLIRVTVSQSFFMRSIPMRWETIKKSLVKALIQAAK